MISLIVAHDPNRVIGRENKMPWHIPEDLAYFKKMTLNKPVIMGRKTFESIGRALPNRENIVVTRNKELVIPHVKVVHSLQDAVETAEKMEKEVMVIGGEQIFRFALPLADRLYITFIQTSFTGDTYFPAYGDEWKLVSKSQDFLSTEGIPYTFLVYEKEKNQ
ncbi:dihydrofolate reductase [Paenisporosarcina cavernae]|uniref:Dihydrofolate reductase n=1 Tax=Paenisporosarcina cavernae TaxID=2320858 RepID=A0A385YRP4_9BACL|nr:dihydrofolate reductase [Paenisporosarcina cavernae]AYC29445.1 dihydrofolate reductase [Paenisporosarcina cavernae]